MGRADTFLWTLAMVVLGLLAPRPTVRGAPPGATLH
jgi:hypothetical protein